MADANTGRDTVFDGPMLTLRRAPNTRGQSCWEVMCRDHGRVVLHMFKGDAEMRGSAHLKLHHE